MSQQYKQNKNLVEEHIQLIYSFVLSIKTEFSINISPRFFANIVEHKECTSNVEIYH